MAIKFRCTHCQQLMGISDRKAGHLVTCTGCGNETLVPPSENTESKSTEADEQRDKSTKDVEQSDDDNSAAVPEKKTVKKEKTKKRDVRERTIKKRDNIRQQERVEKREQLIEESTAPPTPPSSNLWDVDDSEDENVFAIRKAETEFDDMDLTPMVDVTFLLLVFFMITASFSLQKTIQIPAPDPDKQGAAQSETMLEELLDESIQVDINEENVIFIDDEPLSDVNELVSMLSEKMIADGKSELIVTAHAVSLHENVIRVIDAAKEVGMQKIRLASTSSNDE
jgi:biopolymer transport protein ExbD/DNA-directed RNA polymerase subunit M/transcription elongation factor TFIIS